MLNKDCVSQLNRANGVSETEREAALRLLQGAGNGNLATLIEQYRSAMNQDLSSDWLAQKPAPPEIVRGKVPNDADETVDIMGIGGMFAYLNLLYQAHKHGGRHAVVTNPRDIFSFSGWTVHPEEDMDQRLIDMFRTKSLVANEVRRILGSADGPQSVRYKSFKIDYRSMAAMAEENPRELIKNMKVALRYSLLELTDTDKRYAKMNLQRNSATLRALDEMGLIGDDAGRHVANLCGRVVFEVEGETRIGWKKRLKEQFGIVGRRLTSPEAEEVYGATIGVADDLKAGTMSAVSYPGGHFLVGHRENALNAAREKNVLVYDNAIVTRIVVDPEAEKHAVTIRLAEGREKTMIADVLLVALGEYGKDIITIDGVSTLFVIVTENDRYRIHPTGMGEGGTIHIVPVWSLEARDEGRAVYYHVGKATNGAIMGRDPLRPKSLDPDRQFLLHLEANLKRIAPAGARFFWLAATECGRPVSACQGYSIAPLLENAGSNLRPGRPLSFNATGGCGLGGNTAIIPEVQEILDRQSIQRKG